MKKHCCPTVTSSIKNFDYNLSKSIVDKKKNESLQQSSQQNNINVLFLYAAINIYFKNFYQLSIHIYIPDIQKN